MQYLNVIIRFLFGPIGIVIMFVLFFIFTLFWFQIRPASSDYSDKEENTFAFLNHHDSVKYLGAQACEPCHLDKFNSFLETGMGSSFGIADSLKSAAYHNPSTLVYDTLLDLYYCSRWNQGRLFIDEFRLLNKDTVHFRTEAIDYIIGSGQHTNSHLIERNGYLFQAPLTFYTQNKLWDLPPGFRTSNSRFARRIEMECISCHNALPVNDPSAAHKYLSIPKGIDCERCHGPGQLHVAYRMSGQSMDAKSHIKDNTIVNPSRLPWDLQVDVCQRCHLQGNAVLNEGKQFTDYRPGMKLSDVFTVFMPHYQEGSPFKMAAHAERLQQSKCFIESNKKDNSVQKITCITCHNPHVSVKKTGTDIFNKACINCHTSQSATICSKIHHNEFKSANCVACHMPATGSEDIPHVTVHDHYIRKEYSDLNQKPKNLLGLKPINTTHTDTLTLFAAYISYYEKFEHNPFFLQKASELLPFLSNDEYAFSLKIYYYYTRSDFGTIRKLSKLKSTTKQWDAWTAYRIAMSFKHAKEYGSAKSWLDKALEKQSKFIPFLIAKASVLIDDAQYNLASQVLQEVRRLDPKEELLYSEEARLYFHTQNIREANIAARKALELDPNNLQALQILVQLAEISGYIPKDYNYWKQQIARLQKQ